MVLQVPTLNRQLSSISRACKYLAIVSYRGFTGQA